MITLLTVVGARPQFIKAAALYRAIREQFPRTFRQFLLHTGQHYDDNMSDVFFRELDLPVPDFNLSVGSGPHGRQTADMIRGIEEVLDNLRPHFLVLYGDTNSTLAGAIAASKTHTAVIHIEAGLRSFDKHMPEEINRILCDHVSTLLFCPTETAIQNLIREGFNPENKPPFHINHPGIFHSGDIMYDSALFYASKARERSDILQRLKLHNQPYLLVTIHRDSNTDHPERLTSIFRALIQIAEKHQIPVVSPLHPRTTKMLSNLPDQNFLLYLQKHPQLQIIEPVSYLDMIALESSASMIITDSGGVQKEAYFFGKPSIILRPQTEWVEIVEHGAAILADASEENICKAFEHFTRNPQLNFPPIFGNGNTSGFICSKIIESIELK